MAHRHCSRPGCQKPAVRTMTYAYGEQTVVVGPLAPFAEPHTYDLCEAHAGRVSGPRGWQVLVLADEERRGRSDDIEALADAVREAGRPGAGAESTSGSAAGRRGHLRALPTPG